MNNEQFNKYVTYLELLTMGLSAAETKTGTKLPMVLPTKNACHSSIHPVFEGLFPQQQQ